MSDSEIHDLITNFHKIYNTENLKMSLNSDQLKAIVEGAVASALAAQKDNFERKLNEIDQRINSVQVSTPEVETFKDTEIRIGVICNETLDIMKSLPDFEGKNETYVSWRKAAHIVYKVYEKYDGSSKHYQALGILRNKIKNAADMVLSSFDTPLNFKAIINRLDFTYSDKRPIYLIEQEMSTLRQGNLTLLQYYDEVEKKLTLLINKTIMTYDTTVASSLNEKYRADALRVFISGTKKALSDVLFSARPIDLPSALALAQEVESNHERYMFATNFARSIEEKAQRIEQRQQVRDKTLAQDPKHNQPGKSPHYKRPEFSPQQEQVQPMDVDSSSRFRQATQYQQNATSSKQTQWPTQQQHTQYESYNNQGQANKRPNNGSARFTGPKQQRVNHLGTEDTEYEQDNSEYQAIAETETEDVDDELDEYDQVNFLGINPCSRS